MLKSISIKKFKNIKNIEIPSLSQVNLITGKNNTSKTSLLEAIGVLASHFDFGWIYKILKERDESFLSAYGDGKEYNNLKTLSSLFYNREIDFEGANKIFIGDIENTNFISMQFVHYIEEAFEEINPKTNEKFIVGKKRRKIDNTNDFSEGFTGLEVQSPIYNTIIPIDETRSLTRSFSFNYSLTQQKKFQFIKPSFQENEINGILWDKITLSEKEDYVIDILKIVEPDVEKIAFIKDENNRSGRRVTAKVKNISERIALKGMGDGINRVLSIALGLVNADSGYLLIDEFENGLHYSVQKKLWEIIFKLASTLNIQVFATTHSEDCIAAFSEIINSVEYNNLGKLLRLEKINNEIAVVEYNKSELAIATKNEIETR